MDDSDADAPTQATTEQPAAPPSYPASEVSEGGVNLPLLGVLVVILLLVSVSNVWLRRRAERENADRRDES